jgi:hypothetical protein
MKNEIKMNVAGCNENDNETSGSIEDGKFLD